MCMMINIRKPAYNIMPTDIEIAFEMVEYTVSESAGNIEIRVSVISTDLTFPPITIQISSKNGSATGK